MHVDWVSYASNGMATDGAMTGYEYAIEQGRREAPQWDEDPGRCTPLSIPILYLPPGDFSPERLDPPVGAIVARRHTGGLERGREAVIRCGGDQESPR